MYDEIPLRCRACNYQNMVALEALDKRPFSNVITLLGFTCDQCGGWETVSVETTAINNLLAKIGKVKVGSRRYQILMAKTTRKVENLLVKVEEQRNESQYCHEVTINKMG